MKKDLKENQKITIKEESYEIRDYEAAATSYTAVGRLFTGNRSGSVINNLNATDTAAAPVATITDITLSGRVSDALITMGADEMHVYTYAVS